MAIFVTINKKNTSLDKHQFQFLGFHYIVIFVRYKTEIGDVKYKKELSLL